MNEIGNNEKYRYCEKCDQRTAEWGRSSEGTDTCPTCSNTLYQSKDAYISEMVRWLGERFDWPESDAMAFLNDHGNPGKGQALALISTKERREGRYGRRIENTEP